MADREQVQRQLRFLKIDASTGAALQDLEALFESSIDQVMTDFYAHILTEPELVGLFKDEASMARARKAQRRHWLETLFEMELGPAQFEQSKRIAKAHAAIGLLPSWYLASYCFLLNSFIEIFAERFEGDTPGLVRVTQALNKAIFLDINLVIEGYLDNKNKVIRSILARATNFAGDIHGLNDDLVKVSGELQAEAGSATAAELSAHLNRLTAQIEKLNERVGQLRFEDRLYINESLEEATLPPAPTDGSFLARIKAIWRFPPLW